MVVVERNAQVGRVVGDRVLLQRSFAAEAYCRQRARALTAARW